MSSKREMYICLHRTCILMAVCVQDDGKTPLHIACVQKDFQMVQILVEKGADLAAQDNVSILPVHHQWSRT